KRPAEDAAEEEPAQKKPADASAKPDGTYHIHDNGGRPFKVEVKWPGSKAEVKVFKAIGSDDEDEDDDDENEGNENAGGPQVSVMTAGDIAQQLFGNSNHPLLVQMAGGQEGEEEEPKEDDAELPQYETDACLTLSAEKVFVGQCPKHGAIFDGNSILLHLEGLKYAFVGENVFSFTAKSPITQYVSLVGNSDVPYPWAIDEQGFRYLMISSVILNSKLFENCDKDPYDLYFHRALITADIGMVPIEQPDVQFQGITEFWIGEDQYTLKYEPNPEPDYDRLAERGEFFIVKGGPKIKISKTEYVKLMQDFAAEMGFETLHSEELVERNI
ncbi:unnamed protein product, partial [Symbiodinium pilosum]